MARIRKNIVIPVSFMIIILILAVIPMGGIKLRLREHFQVLDVLRSHIQNLFNIQIPFSRFQDFAHVPFFAFLAFLWMWFFNRRKSKTFLNSAIYTIIIVSFFSIFEESCQFFIVRDASLGDLFLNFIGCIIGISIFRLLNHFQTQRSRGCSG